MLFETFFTWFDFIENERFPFGDDLADYRHFLGVIRNRLHNWTPVIEFCGWCLPIYSQIAYGPDREMVHFVRFRLIRPLNWLGLIEEQPTGTWLPKLEEIKVRKTLLFDQFIRFVDVMPGTMTKQ